MIPWRFRRAVYRPIVAHYTEHGEQGDRQDGGEAAGSGPEPSGVTQHEAAGPGGPGSPTPPLTVRR
jgi:hypothetical protein